MLKIATYRYYCNSKKFANCLVYLTNQLKENNYEYTLDKYVSSDLSDIASDEKSIKANLFDFSAYHQAIIGFRQNPEYKNHMYLFLNDTFFTNWPYKLVCREFLTKLNQKVSSSDLPIGMGRVERACNIHNAANTSTVMATHFFLLNNISTEYLYNLLEDLDNIENKISQEYWVLVREIHDQLTHKLISKDHKHAKHLGVLIEHLLSQHIFKDGYLIDVFDTRLIKLLYSFKMFFKKKFNYE